MAEAAVAVVDDNAVFAATAAAGEQTGQQEGRASQAVQPFRASGANADRRRFKLLRQLRLTGLRSLPQLVIDDAQLRHLGPDPLGFGVRPGYPFAGVRVLDEPLPVPHQDPGIEFVIEDAVAPAGVTPDRRIAPGVAERTGDAVLVQIGGDGARRPANRELPKDAANDDRLGLVDRPLATDRFTFAIGAFHNVIAVAEAATRLPLLDPPAQTAMGFRRQVLQEQGIHCALQADMEFGNLAFAEGDDLYAREAQVLEQRRHVGLVARNPVQCFGKDDLELASLCVLQ